VKPKQMRSWLALPLLNAPNTIVMPRNGQYIHTYVLLASHAMNARRERPLLRRENEISCVGEQKLFLLVSRHVHVPVQGPMPGCRAVTGIVEVPNTYALIEEASTGLSA
jgi:hypothetical protein